jgi:hypothetical protein
MIYRGNAAGSNHRLPDFINHLGNRGEVRLGEGAVAIYVSVDKAPHPVTYHRPGKLDGLYLGYPAPATNGDAAAAGINADDNGLTELAAGLFDQVRRLHGGRAQDNPLDAGLEHLLNLVQLTDTAAELGRNQHGTGNLESDIQILKLTGGGAVKVNNVNSRRPQRLPLQGRVQRVVGEDGLRLVVTLKEADALAAPDVYRRDYLYSRLPFLFSIL